MDEEATMTKTTLLLLLATVSIIGFIGWRKAKRELDRLDEIFEEIPFEGM